MEALTVTEFVSAARQILESGSAAVWVEGEIANFTCAKSGHWYFSLRDADTVVDCVMLARENRLAQMPADGAHYAVFGKASLYVPRGRFQLAVKLAQPRGAGDLYQRFLQQKAEWHARGWFAKARPLPPFPHRLGIVCSTAGAALQDVLHILRLRYPLAAVRIYPAPAQGATAAEQIAAMITTAGRQADCDALLVVRGGGGWQDLWAYNEEAVVRAVYECPLPVISGIGHETDETLTDYAADVRCPTPSAAAAAAVPEAAQLREQLGDYAARLEQALQRQVDNYSQRLDWTTRQLATPRQLLNDGMQRWRQAVRRLVQSPLRQLQWYRQQLRLRRLLPPRYPAGLPVLQRRLLRAVTVWHAGQIAAAEARASALALLAPENLLKRGYSMITTPSPDSKVVSRIDQLPARVILRLADGEADADVSAKRRLADCCSD